MRSWLRKLATLGLASVAALATSVIVGSTPPAAADVTPQAYECTIGYMCLYYDINGENKAVGIHQSSFAKCAETPYNAPISSVYNRTPYHIELWSFTKNFIIGTAVSGKRYGYLGEKGNDALEVLVKQGCI